MAAAKLPGLTFKSGTFTIASTFKPGNTTVSSEDEGKTVETVGKLTIDADLLTAYGTTADKVKAINAAAYKDQIEITISALTNTISYTGGTNVSFDKNVNVTAAKAGGEIAALHAGDTVTGGSGVDTFLLDKADLSIASYVTGKDKLKLAGTLTGITGHADGSVTITQSIAEKVETDVEKVDDVDITATTYAFVQTEGTNEAPATDALFTLKSEATTSETKTNDATVAIVGTDGKVVYAKSDDVETADADATDTYKKVETTSGGALKYATINGTAVTYDGENAKVTIGEGTEAKLYDLATKVEGYDGTATTDIYLHRTYTVKEMVDGDDAKPIVTTIIGGANKKLTLVDADGKEIATEAKYFYQPAGLVYKTEKVGDSDVTTATLGANDETYADAEFNTGYYDVANVIDAAAVSGLIIKDASTARSANKGVTTIKAGDYSQVYGGAGNDTLILSGEGGSTVYWGTGDGVDEVQNFTYGDRIVAYKGSLAKVQQSGDYDIVVGTVNKSGVLTAGVTLKDVLKETSDDGEGNETVTKKDNFSLDVVNAKGVTTTYVFGKELYYDEEDKSGIYTGSEGAKLVGATGTVKLSDTKKFINIAEVEGYNLDLTGGAKEAKVTATAYDGSANKITAGAGVLDVEVSGNSTVNFAKATAKTADGWKVAASDGDLTFTGGAKAVTIEKSGEGDDKITAGNNGVVTFKDTGAGDDVVNLSKSGGVVELNGGSNVITGGKLDTTIKLTYEATAPKTAEEVVSENGWTDILGADGKKAKGAYVSERTTAYLTEETLNAKGNGLWTAYQTYLNGADATISNYANFARYVQKDNDGNYKTSIGPSDTEYSEVYTTDEVTAISNKTAGWESDWQSAYNSFDAIMNPADTDAPVGGSDLTNVITLGAGAATVTGVYGSTTVTGGKGLANVNLAGVNNYVKLGVKGGTVELSGSGNNIVDASTFNTKANKDGVATINVTAGKATVTGGKVATTATIKDGLITAGAGGGTFKATGTATMVGGKGADVFDVTGATAVVIEGFDAAKDKVTGITSTDDAAVNAAGDLTVGAVTIKGVGKKAIDLGGDKKFSAQKDLATLVGTGKTETKTEDYADSSSLKATYAKNDGEFALLNNGANEATTYSDGAVAVQKSDGSIVYYAKGTFTTELYTLLETSVEEDSVDNTSTTSGDTAGDNTGNGNNGQNSETQTSDPSTTTPDSKDSPEGDYIYPVKVDDAIKYYKANAVNKDNPQKYTSETSNALQTLTLDENHKVSITGLTKDNETINVDGGKFEIDSVQYTIVVDTTTGVYTKATYTTTTTTGEPAIAKFYNVADASKFADEQVTDSKGKVTVKKTLIDATDEKTLAGNNTKGLKLTKDVGSEFNFALYGAADKAMTIDAREVGKTISIVGNSKVDTILVGEKGATVRGGAGNDKITLGGGADVLAYGAADGTDAITGFDTKADKIQLDEGVYVTGFTGTIANGKKLTKEATDFTAGYALTITAGKTKINLGNVVTETGDSAATSKTAAENAAKAGDNGAVKINFLDAAGNEQAHYFAPGGTKAAATFTDDGKSYFHGSTAKTDKIELAGSVDLSVAAEAARYQGIEILDASKKSGVELTAGNTAVTLKGGAGAGNILTGSSNAKVSATLEDSGVAGSATTMKGGAGKDFFVINGKNVTIEGYDAKKKDTIQFASVADVKTLKGTVSADGNDLTLATADGSVSVVIKNGVGEKLTLQGKAATDTKYGKAATLTYNYDTSAEYKAKNTVEFAASATTLEASKYAKTTKTFDATKLTGELSYTGTDRAETVLVGTNGGDVDAGAGNDTITLTKDATKVTTITIGDGSGKDTVNNFNSGKDKISTGEASHVDVAASGADAVVTAGTGSAVLKKVADAKSVINVNDDKYIVGKGKAANVFTDYNSEINYVGSTKNDTLSLAGKTGSISLSGQFTSVEVFDALHDTALNKSGVATVAKTYATVTGAATYTVGDIGNNATIKGGLTDDTFDVSQYHDDAYTFWFERGHMGADTIKNGGYNDVIYVDGKNDKNKALAIADLTLTMNGDDLVIGVTEASGTGADAVSAETITVKNFAADGISTLQLGKTQYKLIKDGGTVSAVKKL